MGPLRTSRVGTAALILAMAGACAHARPPRMAPQVTGSCRSDLARWYAPEDAAERARLDAWCAGVGPVVMFNGAGPPADGVPLSDIAFASWNVHVGNGDLRAFIEDLRSGRLTNGRVPRHFVLLLQEAVRVLGVPSLPAGAKGARRIGAAHQDTEDIQTLAIGLGLSMVYAPSMRNGNGARDPASDRGNAILSTLPLSNPTAIELPFERQRRVALFAEMTGSAAPSLSVGVVHLDATDAARHLRVFHARGWRATQAMAVENLLPPGPVVVGADLNTWLSGLSGLGSEEPAARSFRQLLGGNPGRGIDYLFFRGSATAHYEVVSSRYGSDHHPLIGWFSN
jgi:endonuclease/exonuclease/phosphatase family metal-dependent hydrolase